MPQNDIVVIGGGVPIIRFNGFTEPWKQRKLGAISDSYSGGTPSVGVKDYYNGDIPFIRSAEINSNYTELSITMKGLKESSSRMVKAGDILYALYGATSGEVGRAKIEGAINQAILCIQPHNGFDAGFIAQWLRQNKNEIINTYLQGGQGNLSGTIVKNLILMFPLEREQKKIGKYFEMLDSLITLNQRKLDQEKKLKKYLLQNMFPREGENVPRIRFPGFTDPWEQRKLGDAADSFEYGLNAAAREFDGKNKYIRITDIDDSTHEFIQTDLTSPDTALEHADNYKLQEGDVLFARTGASVGKTYIYRHLDGVVYFAGFLIRARINSKFDEEFIFQNTLTQNYNKYIRITSQRSGQPGVNAQEYSEYEFMMPTLQEQHRVGEFLRGLDNLITLHQRKLESLKELKKGLLQKMFV